MRTYWAVLVLWFSAVVLWGADGPRHVTIRADNVILIDGAPVFPIGFTKAPPPDGKTPSGSDAYAELKTLGTIFHRCGPPPKGWNAESQAELDHIMDRSAAAGIFGAITMPDFQSLKAGDTMKEAELRKGRC